MDFEPTKQINILGVTKLGQKTIKVEAGSAKSPKQEGMGLVTTLPLVMLVVFLLLWFRSIFKSRPAKYINSRGYVVLSHVNELEHRYIAKQMLVRELKQNEIVHHINGKKTDNRIWNLCLMDKEKHEHFHSWLRWKKEKSGSYPSFKDQKRALEEEYKGTLLENLKSADHAKHCPKCNSPMVLRTSKKGPDIGKQFWGCSRFPRCKCSLAA
jgi:hypothetical protein